VVKTSDFFPQKISLFDQKKIRILKRIVDEVYQNGFFHQILHSTKLYKHGKSEMYKPGRVMERVRVFTGQIGYMLTLIFYP
jgi:hypothetical protein